MANGLLTPLQLTAGAALINNGGITVGYDLTQLITQYNQTAVISAWQSAVNYYISQPWHTSGVLADLLSIGNSVCAALGNSIPSAALTPRPVAGPVDTGFSGLIVDTANLYLGNGDVGKFAQAFFAAQGYCNTANVFINSSANAQTYLGPTFRNMSALTTNNISAINSNFQGFGVDLKNQGKLVDLSDIKYYGTPAALLKQLSNVADIQGRTLKIVEDPLILSGLTKNNIQTLIVGNRDADPLTFDQYQRLAYIGMTKVVGNDLQQVLSILEVQTVGINSMADLLDQKIIFPNSWSTFATPTPNGFVPVYLPDGSVDMNIADQVSVYMPTASGCEELGKIVPPGIAVASKAVQSSYQQLTGITQTTLPALAQTVLGQPQYTWSASKAYIANTVVSNKNVSEPAFYRAQQNVPAGVDINNTDYWKPTTLGGLSTMAGLPDIQSQTKALPDNVAAFYQSMAIGSGPNGTITVGDVLGAAAGDGYLVPLAKAIAGINLLVSNGSLSSSSGLIKTYTDMLAAANDTQMTNFITQANADIVNIATNNVDTVAAMNLSWLSMANKLNTEYVLQQKAEIVWSDIPANSQTSVFALVQGLPRAGLEVNLGDPGWYLDQIADRSTQGGQAVVGVMRESRNARRLNASQLGLDTTPSDQPAITPSPAVVPVY